MNEDAVMGKLHEAVVALLTLTQGFFSLFAFGDVLNVRDEIERLTGGIAQKIAANVSPNGSAIFVQILLFDFEKLDLPVKQLPGAGEAGVQLVRMRDVLEAQLQQFSLRVTEHLT